jgi:hypothetical protein
MKSTSGWLIPIAYRADQQHSRFFIVNYDINPRSKFQFVAFLTQYVISHNGKYKIRVSSPAVTQLWYEAPIRVVKLAVMTRS